MKHVVSVLTASLLACLPACRKSAPATLASASAAPSAAVPSAPPAVVSTFGPVVASEVEVSGLRVRSGTLRARGSDVTARAGSDLLWGFSDLSIDSKRLALEIALPERGAPLAQLLPAGALAVVNGGYFEADFRPSTWLKSKGVELGKKTDTSRGGVLAIGAEVTYVGPFAGLAFEPTLAIQSFPLIVEPDGKLGIHRDDGRRAARTVACLVGNVLHFIVISAPRGEGPTLFESAALLSEAAPGGFGCRVALNLDGGPSSGVWFAPNVPSKQRPPFAPVGYAIVIAPR